MKKDIKKKRRRLVYFNNTKFFKKGLARAFIKDRAPGILLGYCEHYPLGTLRGNKSKMEHTEPRGTCRLPLKSDGDDRRKIPIKPLRETKVGVAKA